MDGSKLNQTEARVACQRRNNSFLPRITNSYVQHKLSSFREAENDTLRNAGFWIDVWSPGGPISNFQWIDGSSLAGLYNFVQLLLL